MVDPDKNLVSKLAILGITVDDQIRQLIPLRDNDGVLVAAFAGPPPYLGDQLGAADIIHAVNGRRGSASHRTGQRERHATHRPAG
jgi:hypothetical protein